MAPRARFELATLRLTAECSTIELPGIISILCYLRSIFKQRLGDMGDMICNNRGETHLDTRRKRAIDFGANLPANFGLARFINIRSKFLHSSLSSRQTWARIPRAANVPFLNSLYSDEHSVRDRMVAAREAEQRQCELSNVRTISLCCEFFGGEECLWFFYSHLFSARITFVIFCHNDCLRRIYADPDRKGRSF